MHYKKAVFNGIHILFCYVFTSFAPFILFIVILYGNV